jgi:YHS domain-containing protein
VVTRPTGYCGRRTFKDLVSVAIDPVCGKAVEREAATTVVADGETPYFCSTGCRDEYASGTRGTA